MDWKKVSFGTVGIAGILALIIASKAEQYYAKTADTEAVTLRSDDDTEILVEAEKSIKEADELLKRESKELSEKLRAWKKVENYDNKIRDIHNSAMTELDEFKNSIDYYNRKREIEDEAEDALTEFKDSIDYDYEVECLEDEIDDAEDLYNKRVKLFEITGGNDDDVSEIITKLKSAEKTSMENTIKKAKAKIKELDAQVEAEEHKINKKKQQAIRELDSEIYATKTQIEKTESEQSSALRKRFDEAKNDFRKEIEGKRSADEKHSLETYDVNRATISKIYKEDEDRAYDIYNNAPKCEKIGEYLKSVDCPKWFVASVGAVPLAAICYIGYAYTKFMFGIIKSM